LEGIESIELSVVANNPAAVKLYKTIGFEIFGLQKNYFKNKDRYWDQQFMQLTRRKYLSERDRNNKHSLSLDRTMYRPPGDPSVAMQLAGP
jgi:ribosomal protein S18 acetylase RimI-like enzyme